MIKAAFSAHRIDRHQLKPLRDAVIVGDMNFEERLSNGGIVLVKDNGKSSGIRPRWVPPPLPDDMQGIQGSFEKQFGTTKLPNGRT